ncbi:MAG: hypothetical protein N0E48_26275 [Candidatus Thiodiazotropha endolucinida]|nr:hypothetical protein [Candidatus Thiodiazotropha taylori]MCW4346834.1 hypothetical protein [Candidatus Thiodiazotropha endolucinida]
MNSQDDIDKFEDTSAITPSASALSMVTLPPSGTTDNRKKRKIDTITEQTISENNIAKFKVLKKLNIQLTRTDHHINYLRKCERTRSTPKSLRVNLTPQVPVVSSALHLKWEEAILNFGLTLTRILLEYWENRRKHILEEIDTILGIIKETTDAEEVEYMTSIIDRITISVEKNLSTPKSQAPSSSK